MAQTLTGRPSPVAHDDQLPEIRPVRERRSWPLPLAAPDLSAFAVLAAATHQLAGTALAKAVLLAGAVLVVRRAAAGAWLGRESASPNLTASRRRARRGALACAALALAAGVSVALAWEDTPVAAVALGLAVVPGALVPLEAQALRSCARRGQLLAAGLAGGGATLVGGLVLLAVLPTPVLGPMLALAIGDLAALVVGRHRSHAGVCHAAGMPSSTPVEPHRRPLLTAALSSALVGCMHLLPLGALLTGNGDDTLVASLVVLGLLPLVAAGTMPTLAFHDVPAGRPGAVVPPLLAGAVLGTAATLLVLTAPGALLGLSDGRLPASAAYFCVAMALLGLGQVVIHHRSGAGADQTALVLAVLAAGVQALLVALGAGTPADVGVEAALGGAVVLLVSLVVAAVAATPVPFTLPVEEAGDGPRLVGWSLLVLTGAALVARLASPRPLWLDEAATARLAEGSLPSLLTGGLEAEAHPPLQTALSWAARQVMGEGAFALRLPSLLAGVLLVPVLYVTGRELYSRRTGLLAAAVASFAPALVWFSAEARPPALAALLAAVSLLAMTRAVRRGRSRDWVLFGLAGAALAWTHHLALVHLAVLHAGVALFLWRRREEGEPVRPALAGWVAALAILAAAVGPLLAWRSGLGTPRILPPLEFATAAAPGGGSVFSALGTVVTGVLGFHPADVTSRLLALWPLGILATMLVVGRARSHRGVLLLALSAAPFAALVVAQLLGAPRRPPQAVGWVATALPMFALLVGRGLSLIGGRWPRARFLTLGMAALLLVALVDQRARVKPADRFDVVPVVAAVGDEAGPQDVIVYEPRALRDLVSYEAQGTPARAVDRAPAAALQRHRRVYVIGAFALGRGRQSADRAVNLVRELSSTRPLLEERRGREMTVWVFG